MNDKLGILNNSASSVTNLLAIDEEFRVSTLEEVGGPKAKLSRAEGVEFLLKEAFLSSGNALAPASTSHHMWARFSPFPLYLARFESLFAWRATASEPGCSRKT
jgi:hypothetical protein